MMANDNNARQKSASSTPKATNTTNTANNTDITRTVPAAPAPVAKNGGAKSNKPRVGGTAVPGAKSTLPKQIPTNNNSAQQQTESYNRDMRRRMQHLGTGPNENKANTIQEQRRKRVERRKQRVEEERARLRRSTPGGKITLGRRNLYFILGTVALVVLLIVIFVVLRMNHIIQS
ncbi:MAG TPA: hypothetical protein VGT82_09875 [Ktedonobacteraceae bacterium]|nr:hypothetical protein [Ktedonobacteraceae bacterium]